MADRVIILGNNLRRIACEKSIQLSYPRDIEDNLSRIIIKEISC